MHSFPFLYPLRQTFKKVSQIYSKWSVTNRTISESALFDEIKTNDLKQKIVGSQDNVREFC